jgi:hypothetical protein
MISTIESLGFLSSARDARLREVIVIKKNEKYCVVSRINRMFGVQGSKIVNGNGGNATNGIEKWVWRASGDGILKWK